MTPQVTVIVTHHLDECRPYLDLCLKALSRSEGVTFETIVISDAETCPEVPDGMTLVHDRRLDTVSKKFHFGVAMSDQGTKYLLNLSDDVVVGKYTLANLVKGAGDRPGIYNPMSNSDNQGQFVTELPWGCEAEISDHVEGYNVDVFAFQGTLLVTRPYVCFYCTLIPRNVWNAVGPLDEALHTRHNDQDWCMRAAKLGIPSFINFGAFALHFGSKTLHKVAPLAERDIATKHFIEKWQGKV